MVKVKNKLTNFYKGKKVLVTGATGFKGSWLCEWLLLLGAKVYAAGNNPNKNKNLFYDLNLNNKLNLKIFDIRNFKQTKKFINKINPSIIFHLAAQPLISNSYKDPKITYEINTMGTLNILEAARENKKIKNIILITSDKCYQSNNSTVGFKETDRLGGKDPYSGSKACAEIIIKTYIESYFKYNKVGIASARAGNVIGGGDWSENRLIPDLINNFKKKKTTLIRNPNFNRPWQHVLEPLYGYLLLGIKLQKNPKKYSGSWNFGTEKNTVTSVKEIANIAQETWGKGKIIIKNTKKFYEQENLQLNISKSKKILSWKPIYSIRESVRLTVNWYKNTYTKKTSVEEETINQIYNYMNAI